MQSVDTTSKFEALATRLFPVARSICGPAFKESTAILTAGIPFTEHRVPSGEKILDWRAPQEWELHYGVIRDSRGKTIVDSRDSPLHVVNFSESFQGTLSLEALQDHLYSLPDKPNWIPYVTSYYEKRWGFCIADSQRQKLSDGNYTVELSTTKVDGFLSYFTCDLLADSESDEWVLLSTYFCHPSLGNNELSGPLAMVRLYEALSTRSRRVNYRFLIAPETVGAIAFLDNQESDELSKIVAGIVLTCLGGPSSRLSTKLSRRAWVGEPSLIDQIALDFSAASPEDFCSRDFDPAEGSDERQFCSPGFNLPIIQCARTPYGSYPEYHTSGDDLEFMDISAVLDSCDRILMILQALELANLSPRSTVPFGEPFLSSRNLHPTINVGGELAEYDSVSLRFRILSLAEGSLTLSQIWQKLRVSPILVCQEVLRLEEVGLLVLDDGHN